MLLDFVPNLWLAAEQPTVAVEAAIAIRCNVRKRSLGSAQEVCGPSNFRWPISESRLPDLKSSQANRSVELVPRFAIVQRHPSQKALSETMRDGIVTIIIFRSSAIDQLRA